MSGDEKTLLLLLALGLGVVVIARARAPVVEVIPSNEPLRGRVVRLDDGWRLDR